MKTTHTHHLRKALSLLLALLTISAASALAACSKDPDTITETLNLASIRANTEGQGYEWNNMTETLTLDGLNIVTEDEYGLKLPSEATVVLKGKNYISAASCALVCTGKTTFTGSGSLTIVSGKTGISCSSVRETDLVHFLGGEISITAQQVGITSESSALSLMGSDISIEVIKTDGERSAVSGKSFSASSGSLTANASIRATASITVSAAELSITSTEPALICDNGIKLDNVSIRAGATENDLASVSEYSAENAVILRSTAKSSKRGILFNADYPRVFDYLIFAALILLTAAVIAVPAYLKHKRTKKLIEAQNAANPPKKTKNKKR